MALWAPRPHKVSILECRLTASTLHLFPLTLLCSTALLEPDTSIRFNNYPRMWRGSIDIVQAAYGVVALVPR